MDVKVDQKDVLELAAQKVADQVLEHYGDLEEMASNRIEGMINSIVTDEVRQSMIEAIDAKMAEEIEKALQQEIVPVDMWGESKGDPAACPIENLA